MVLTVDKNMQKYIHFSFKVVVINHIHNSCPFDLTYCYWSPLIEAKKILLTIF